MKVNWIKTPFLPQNTVTLAFMSHNEKIFQKILEESFSIRVLSVPALCKIPEPVGSHADMVCCPLGENRIAVERSQQQWISELQKIGFVALQSDKSAHEVYPNDVLLNGAFIGNRLFCNPKTLDPSILNYALKSDYTIASVRQGYTKCSIAVITESAIITADQAIAKKAKELKMDVLEIREGHIELSGFSYGFIGGCCGKLSRDLMVFTGNIDLHPDGKNIITFLRNYGIYSCSLTQEHILKDIGGIIPVAEI